MTPVRREVVNKVKLCECGCGKPTPIAKFTRSNCGYIKGQPLRFLRYHASRTVPKTDKEERKALTRKCVLWYKYRITPEEQLQIKNFQAQHPVFSLLLGKKLGTDHNHKTGLIRGLLEWRLNRAYGTVEKFSPNNTAAVLRALADFHENPPATIALGGKRFGLIGKAMSKKKPMYGSENGPIKAIKKVRKCKR